MADSQAQRPKICHITVTKLENSLPASENVVSLIEITDTESIKTVFGYYISLTNAGSAI